MQTKKTANYITLFLIGFAICAVLGNLLCGESAETGKGFYSFFYQTIPALLGRVVGLPASSTVGMIFTLAAGVFFLVLSFKMFTAFCDDGKWDAWGDLLTFGLAFFYTTIVSSIMIDPALADGFLTHKFLIFFPILFFVGYIVLVFSGFKKGSAFGRKRVCFLLSTVGFSMSLAALTSVILGFKLERVVVIPAKAAEIFFGMAASSNNGAFTAVKFILIQAVLTALMCAFYHMIRNAADGLEAETIGFGILLYWSYSPVAGTNIFPQGVKYWLFLFVIVCIMADNAKKFNQNGKKVLASGIGLAISVPCLYYSIVGAYSAVNSSFEKTLSDLAPMKEKARDFVMGIFPAVEGQEMGVAGMIAVTAVIAVVTLLLFLPIKGKKGKDDDSAAFLMVAMLAFLGGVMLRSTGLTHHIILKVAYGVVVAAVVVYVGSLVLCINEHRKVGKFVYGFAVTALLTPAFCLFAQTIGIVVAAVVLAIILLLTIKNNLEAAPTKGDIRMKRIMNAIDYADKIADINEALANGAHEGEAKAAADRAAYEALGRDQELKDEMDKL